MNKNQRATPSLTLNKSSPISNQDRTTFLKEENQVANPLDDYISKEDFMTQFGIKRGLYYKLINRGLRVYYLGSKTFLRKSEIDNALKNHQLK